MATQCINKYTLRSVRAYIIFASLFLRYTQEEMVALVEYGRQRSVKVMIEFDMPGHAGSWCTGYPDICPSMKCSEPLNPASNSTFPLIESLLGECTGYQAGSGLFPYGLLHLGGDEVS